MFREIFVSITTLTTLNSHWGLNKYYFEDIPSFKASDFVGFPVMVIKTDSEQESLTIKNKKQMMYTTTATIYVDYLDEKKNESLNDYLNAIVYWFNNNKNTLRWTYKLWGLSDIEKDRDTTNISQKKLVVAELTFNYHVTLDMVD